MSRSGLSRQELRDFAQEIRDIICEERPSSGRPLGSATIRKRLEERGVEVPDYAMYDVFEDLKGGLIELGFGGPTNPDVEPDAEVVWTPTSVPSQAAAVELGICVPPSAWTYWNLGPGPGLEYADTDHGKEWSSQAAKTSAHNVFHVAQALKGRPHPAGGVTTQRGAARTQ